MSQKYEKLKTLLQELFQLDQPDLDFGLYRVMHAKSAEVSQFLDRDLLPQVQSAFGQYKTADKADLEKELAKVIAGIEAAGMDPAQSPKVSDLRTRIANDAVDINALESEVYDHLFSFFRRYYSEGDFLAKRVYRPGVYAIPYEGEEVTLHWANKDQYYIKTSEYLRDYAFRLQPDNEQKPMRVHFRLADATEGEHGNVKTAEGKDRVFIPAAENFIAEETGELVIRFEYRPATLTDWPDDAREGKTKPPAQKDLTALATRRVLATTDALLASWIAELGKPHINAKGEKTDSTRLEVHLKRYTARNTFDYFIHKDLGGFLRRELDFYIKNEVMHLDDVESETVPRVEQYLSKIKVMRKIAGKIIAFLAQLEDFQKKLWLKKKFVVETQYCITVGCIPEAFYPEIVANDAQHEEWVNLFAIDEIKGDLIKTAFSKPLKPEFLKANSTLVLDTRLFSSDFNSRLLEAMGNLNEQLDGVLVQSENSQALRLLEKRYQAKIKCVYSDPPYNTTEETFVYKNQYQHSSWLSMISGAAQPSYDLLADDGIMFMAIDDAELYRLKCLLDEIFINGYMGTLAVQTNPRGRGINSHFATSHDYCLTYSKSPNNATIIDQPLTEKQAEAFAHGDGDKAYRLLPFRRSGGLSTPNDRENSEFALFFDDKKLVAVGGPRKRHYPELYESDFVFTLNPSSGQMVSHDFGEFVSNNPNLLVVMPVDSGGARRVWRWSDREKILGAALEGDFVLSSTQTVQMKDRIKPGRKPKTLWYDSKYDASSHGTNLIQDIFGARGGFAYPKSIHTVRDTIYCAVGGEDDDSWILDCFGGSGTTAQAVIEINRDQEGSRKFVLIEMGDYFSDVTVPRVQKIIYSPEWSDGKPKRLITSKEAERSPRIVKIIRLESYEDALNNLDTRRTETQQSLLNTPEAQGIDGLKEQYLLRYMLEVETRGSQSLLNIQAFTDPTAYKLKVKRPGSDESREVNVDLLETFNWLIGLTVQHITAPQNFSAAFERDSEKRLQIKGRLKLESTGPWWFRTVTGTTPDGRKTLIIWRKLTGDPEQDNLVLDEWFRKHAYSTKDVDFDLIYVNGGNNLPNVRHADETWKVRLIEEDFHRLMFEADA